MEVVIFAFCFLFGVGVIGGAIYKLSGLGDM